MQRQPAEQTTFEREIRAFLERSWPPAEQRRTDRAERAFVHALVRRGWSVPHWPVGWGGTGWPAAHCRGFDRLLAEARAPVLDPLAVDLVAGLVLEHGTVVQREAHLPGIRDAGTRWCAHASLWEHAPLHGGRDRAGVLRSLDAQVTGCRDAHRAGWMIAFAADARAPELLALVLIDLDPRWVEIAPAGFPGLGADRLALRARPLEPAQVLIDASPAVSVRAAVRRYRDAAHRVRARRLAATLEEVGDVDPALVARRRALEIELAGLEALEERAFATADARLTAAVVLRLQSVALAVSAWLLDALGYYALPAVEPLAADNEPPLGPRGAQRALREAFGYVGSSDDGFGRDHLAGLLGLES